MKHEKYITLWRPSNQGYCFSKDDAGLYINPTEGYHDSEESLPISEADADKLFQMLPYDNELMPLIPNNKETWDILNVRMAKKHLIKRIINSSKK